MKLNFQEIILESLAVFFECQNEENKLKLLMTVHTYVSDQLALVMKRIYKYMQMENHVIQIGNCMCL